MADTVVITLPPALAARLDTIRRRYAFTREEMIRLMIANYPIAPEQTASQPDDPIAPRAIEQITLTLEEAARAVKRAQAAADDWRTTFDVRAAQINSRTETGA